MRIIKKRKWIKKEECGLKKKNMDKKGGIWIIKEKCELWRKDLN